MISSFFVIIIKNNFITELFLISGLKDTLYSGILSPTMPAVQRSEFALALNQVASERGVDVSVVLDTVKNAILAAYRKDHPGVEIEEYTAELSPITGEAKIFHEGKDIT